VRANARDRLARRIFDFMPAAGISRGLKIAFQNGRTATFAVSLEFCALWGRILWMTVQTYDREPSPDERAGMDLWNSLPTWERTHWLTEAKAASVAEAWLMFKRGRRLDS